MTDNIEALMVEFGNAMFDCGEWDQYDNTDQCIEKYEILQDKANSAQDKLRVAIANKIERNNV